MIESLLKLILSLHIKLFFKLTNSWLSLLQNSFIIFHLLRILIFYTFTKYILASSALKQQVM